MYEKYSYDIHKINYSCFIFFAAGFLFRFFLLFRFLIFFPFLFPFTCCLSNLFLALSNWVLNPSLSVCFQIGTKDLIGELVSSSKVQPPGKTFSLLVGLQLGGVLAGDQSYSSLFEDSIELSVLLFGGECPLKKIK